MSNSRSYAIIGTGGVGGYFGGRLALCGHDVRFLLHSDYDYVRQNGLTVKSSNGDFALPVVQAFNSVATIGQVDVVVVCLKTTSEDMLREMLPPLLKPSSIVILIQNGIGVEAEVERLVPGVRLVAGLAFIGTAKVAPGHIDHQFYGNINLAPYNLTPQNLETLDAVADDFRTSGVPIKIMEYHVARWKKAVWNMPFNGLSVAMRCQTDTLLEEPALSLIRDLMKEVVGAAQACGMTDLRDNFIDVMIDSTRQMPPYSPSMKLDFDFGRPMEIEFLYRRPIAMAQAAGFDMPKMRMLEQILSVTSMQMGKNA